MEVNLCDRNANELAAYLADHGARNYKVMVVIAQPFGRVFEIWNQDMGLGPAEPRFMAVNEEDVGLGVVHDADELMQAIPGEVEFQEQEQAPEEDAVAEEGDPMEVAAQE